MFKKCLDCVKNIKLDKVAVFAGGVLFGTAGLKVLGSKDAKKVTHRVLLQCCAQRIA